MLVVVLVTSWFKVLMKYDRPQLRCVFHSSHGLLAVVEVAYVVQDFVNGEELLQAVELYRRPARGLDVVAVPFRNLIFNLAYPIHITQNLHAYDVQWRLVLPITIVKSEISEIRWQAQDLRHHAFDRCLVDKTVKVEKAEGDRDGVARVHLHLVLMLEWCQVRVVLKVDPSLAWTKLVEVGLGFVGKNVESVLVAMGQRVLRLNARKLTLRSENN